MNTYKLDSSKVIKVMSSKNEPALVVEPDSIIEIETVNCFGGQPLTAGDGPLKFDPDIAGNPSTGPIFVKGAEKGDVLKVEVLEIIPTSDAVMGMDTTMGVYAPELPHDALRFWTVKDGETIFYDNLALKNNPMLGVIGTAPEAPEEIPTMTPGVHGANMDCNRITAGCTIYLPVNTEGALLAVGDVHAVMGDGESCGGGAEVSAHVKLKVSVLKGSGYPTPFVLSEGHAMTLYSAESLDDAADNAARMMHRFLQKELGLPYVEAAMLLSLIGDIRICQVVDPLKTCRMEVPLYIFEKYNYKFK